jgi:tetratricopeptide (TPR) repeat protein
VFDAIKRMSVTGSTALVILQNDWSNKLQHLTDRLANLQNEIAAAEQLYRDAALAADEGGQAEAKQREQAYSKLGKALRQQNDIEAAIEAARERAARDAEKQRKEARQQRAEAISAHHRKMLKCAQRLDTAMAELAAAAAAVNSSGGDLVQAGVRARVAYSIIPEIPRLLGSHFLKAPMDIGLRHPFDTAPQCAVDRVPSLADVLRNGDAD